jgi:nucleoside-diphosphate-sugar epimerase
VKALVTGSAGFLGSHFTAALKERDWDVIGIDVRHPEAGEYAIDCRDYFHEMQTSYDLVVHCAAVIPDRARREANPMLVAENLDIDRQMFEWAIVTHQERVLYLSSSAAYPVDLQTEPRKLSEADLWPATARNADGLYGWTKVLGEMHAETARTHGVPVTVVRPFTGYGTDQSADYPFPAIVDRATAHQDPLLVWGSGRQVRDFVHVDDIVTLALAAVGKNLDGPINIGTGVPTTMIQLARMVAAAADYEPQIACVVSKPDGVAYRVNGSDLGRRLMGLPVTSWGTGGVAISSYYPADAWRFITLAEGIKRAL